MVLCVCAMGLVTWMTYAYATDVTSFVERAVPVLDKNLRVPVFGTVAAGGVIAVAALFIWIVPAWRREPKAHDLLYYLGFMGTLLGLGGASVALASIKDGAPAGSITLIVAQNGVALGTTLFGMVLRNSLRYCYPPTMPPLAQVMREVEEAAKTARDAISRLNTNVAEFNTTLGQLAISLSASTRVVREEAPAWESLGGSAESMQGALSGVAQSMSAIASRFEQMQASSERSLGNMSEIATQTEAAGGRISETLQSMAGWLNQLRGQMEQLYYPPSDPRTYRSAPPNNGSGRGRANGVR